MDDGDNNRAKQMLAYPWFKQAQLAARDPGDGEERPEVRAGGALPARHQLHHRGVPAEEAEGPRLAGVAGLIASRAVCAAGGGPAGCRAAAPAACRRPTVARDRGARSAPRMTQLGIPGLAAAVVIARAGCVWSAPFGMADLENGVPRHGPTTVYRLASVSKPITAVAVLQLVERGQARPRRAHPALRARVPGEALAGDRRASCSATRAASATRRTRSSRSTRRYASVAEALALFRDDPLLTEPGTQYLYTSLGYNLLGARRGGRLGRELPRLPARERVRARGHGRRRATTTCGRSSPTAPQGYVKTPSGDLRNSELADTSNKLPGGGLVATAEDVARFAMALTGGPLARPRERRTDADAPDAPGTASRSATAWASS